MVWRLRAAPLWAALLAWLACAARCADAGVELSNSVIFVTWKDVEPHMIEGRWQRQCEAVIENAKKWKSRKISLVVTVHWAGGRRGIDYYQFKTADGGFEQASQYQLNRWENGLKACFQAATKAGFSHLHILTHLDDPGGLWRNGLLFDPTRKYGGFSYVDVVLMPAARAAASAVNPWTSVEFCLTGEMTRSLITFPKAYMQLAGPVKAAVQSGKNKPKWVTVGVSMNWQRHCGCVSSNERDAVRYNETYAGAVAAQKDNIYRQYDVNGFKNLLWQMDFIGLSGYGVLPPNNVSPRDFETAIHTLAYELSFWGISLRDLTRNKPLVFSEWGLGGSGRSYGSIAQNSFEAGRFPVHGKWMQYDPSSDPWRRSDLREYRRQVYSALMEWLKNDGGPTFKIDGFYLWSVGTWDVMNVHPYSENERGAFGDRDIQQKVLQLNGQVNGL